MCPIAIAGSMTQIMKSLASHCPSVSTNCGRNYDSVLIKFGTAIWSRKSKKSLLGVKI